MDIDRKLILILIAFTLYSNSLAKLNREWFKHTTIYQLITAVFKDSDGDGIGDLKGIISKLDYLKESGIECIHLTPMFNSPLLDMGYDISDYYNVDSRYGTMGDFENLMKEMKKRGMKLILDLVINHTSDQHDWFLKSIDRIDPYTDYYVWKDPKWYDSQTQRHVPPNNWKTVFNSEEGSGWTWNDKRNQFYFHHFIKEQVDLNLRNPIVKEELKKILKFWLDKGVAGFRMDAVRFYMEDEFFRDNEWYSWRQMDEEGSVEFVAELREFLDEYTKSKGDYERVFLPEVHVDGDMDRVRSYYDRGNYHIAQMPYTYFLRYFQNGELHAWDLHYTLINWIDHLPKNAISTWVSEDHDSPRIGTRLRPEHSDIMLTISMLLPGSVGIYYGQEIAMDNGIIKPDQIRDILANGFRDPNRLPMQWDDTLNAGFSTNIQTFSPLNSDYFSRNVENQKKQKRSHYKLFKTLTKLRQDDVLKYGNFKSYVYLDSMHILTRFYNDRIYIVITNLNLKKAEITLSKVIGLLPDTISVVATSVNAIPPKEYKLGLRFTMSPLSCIVLEGHNLKSI